MKSSEAKPTDEDLDEISDEGSMSASEGDEDDEDMEDGLVDMEDLGKVMKKRKNHPLLDRRRLSYNMLFYLTKSIIF